LKRIPILPRANLKELISSAGFTFAESPDGTRYWDESAYYRFTLAQIEDDIESASNEIAALCVELVERAIVDDELFDALGLPPQLQGLARESWQRGDGTLYGRFDFSYDGHGPAKLLEYNADTPTGLYEASVFQWSWLEDKIENGDIPKDSDQFNSIHDCLIEQWRHLAVQRVHFACMPDVEDEVTVEYLAQTARLAGIESITLLMEEIGDTGRMFIDREARPIDTLFKLYPWEWLIEDRFSVSQSMKSVRFIEPAWKAILSTKAILPLLWKIAPGHPNLLPARFSDDAAWGTLNGSYVRKPLRSREGANVTVVENCRIIEMTGGRSDDKCVDQALAKLPDFNGHRPVIGSWIVGKKSCGIGIREGLSEVTTNTSRFIPHIII
jgi:glutathionylspermidine synthase